ncbi:hypothetical protein Ga0123461_0503 [Mariprofundus aestuarium]|uniref:Uncharacterized protein n=1 Tax=Mariprofundus aestuarium TaxID=1921086 RepID=A0A2K8KVT8_MARES|nr:hypothetical protein Ga0123461_0503 [Mariprofundus aestuarium]
MSQYRANIETDIHAIISGHWSPHAFETADRKRKPMP